MAGAADPDPPPPPKTSLFLGCFGFSGKRTGNSTKISAKRRRRSTFLLKQSAAAKSALKKTPAAVDLPLNPQTPPPVPLETKTSLDKRVTVEDGGRSVPVSQPGSPDGSNQKTVTRSTSLPGRVRTEIPAANDKLEPMMGMSIIAVTLVIMLIWGRLFAVLCTCSWLYFVPRPRRKPGLTNGLVFSELEPEEHVKKRVVFQGFLKRSRNHSFS